MLSLLLLFLSYQTQLLLPCHLLDMVFQTHGGLFVLTFLPVNKLDRKAGTGIFCPMPAVMAFQPRFDIVGPSSIKSAVRAFEQIGAGAFLLTHGALDGTPTPRPRGTPSNGTFLRQPSGSPH